MENLTKIFNKTYLQFFTHFKIKRKIYLLPYFLKIFMDFRGL